MKQVILGTAGHIDHGKTALVQALTGIDTDRLKEEKERGITIDLGFAFMDLNGDIQAGVVDVPGHERFVRNMLAGAGGIDLVLLVVAADEGVMPQTREHLAICQLLGIQDGVVAVAKKDLVEEDWLGLIVDDLKGVLRGTFLEGKPVVPVSSRTGEGLDQLRKALADRAREVKTKDADGPLRLPIDRVFTMRGFGAVVTGTLLSGRLHLEERVAIYPKDLTGRVRGLQIHGNPVGEAWAGQRTAVNLQGVEKEALERGDVLATADSLQASHMLDATLRYLPDATRPLKNRDRVRFHQGTAEVIGRVALIGQEILKPGEEGFVQLRLEKPVVVRPRDRYVLRSYSPVTTIGGGEILDSQPPKHRRLRPEVRGHFEALAQGDEEARIEIFLRRAGTSGLTLAHLMPRTASSRKALLDALDGLKQKGQLEFVDRQAGWTIHQEAFHSLQETIQTRLKKFHQQNPLKPGFPKEELRTQEEAPDKVFSLALSRLEGKEIALEGDLIRLLEHRVSLGTSQTELREKIERRYREAGCQPPRSDELWQELGVDRREDREVLQVLVNEGVLVRLKEHFLFHRENLEKTRDILRTYLKEKREITAAEFRDLLGITRKHAIPLLEHFDSSRLTLRVGDKRVLRKK